MVLGDRPAQSQGDQSNIGIDVASGISGIGQRNQDLTCLVENKGGGSTGMSCQEWTLQITTTRWGASQPNWGHLVVILSTASLLACFNFHPNHCVIVSDDSRHVEENNNYVWLNESWVIYSRSRLVYFWRFLIHIRMQSIKLSPFYFTLL